MIGAISGAIPYYNVYGAAGTPQRPSQAQNARKPEAAPSVQGGSQASLWAARRGASPETPVQPVSPVRPVDGDEAQPVRLGPVLREGADPAEMAVRMRMQNAAEPGRLSPSQSARLNTLEGQLDKAENALAKNDLENAESILGAQDEKQESLIPELLPGKADETAARAALQ